MLSRTTFCALSWLLASCAGGLAQVPESQPHGVVRIRVVHPAGDRAYEDHLVLDSRPAVRWRREASVRLSPGTHALTLVSFGQAYDLRLETRTDPVGSCITPACRGYVPRQEERYALAPRDQRSCSQTLELHVSPGQHSLALFVAGPGATCHACERSELSARSCP